MLEDEEGDLCGHGTACAGIVRALAPDCEIVSVRVLGAGYTGSGPVLMAGLEWAVEQKFDVINMSLSTTKRKFSEFLHELADEAYFGGSVIVASAHNMPVESFPWRFSSVLSVGSHDPSRPAHLLLQPEPAGGVLRPRPRPGRAVARRKHAALQRKQLRDAAHDRRLLRSILSKHRELTPFQLKSVLHATASNVEEVPA